VGYGGVPPKPCKLTQMRSTGYSAPVVSASLAERTATSVGEPPHPWASRRVRGRTVEVHCSAPRPYPVREQGHTVDVRDGGGQRVGGVGRR
jgi:hypothetical protein